MGYHKDLGTSIVAGFDSTTGYPVDQYGHLLDKDDLMTGQEKEIKVGDELYNLTSPYGFLEFAVGSADDFYCFDYRTITGKDGKQYMVLHSVINSETGSYIQDGSYNVVPIEDACPHAAGMAEEASRWCGENSIRHNRSGWNQDRLYFFRAVCANVGDKEFSDRQKRYGGKRIERFCEEMMK